MGLVSLLFSFKGRINRVQYWLGCLVAGMVGGFLLFALGLLALPNGPPPKTAADMAQTVWTFCLVLGVPFILMGWTASALQTKRFHDRGRSGLWALLPFLPIGMILVNVISGFTTGQHPEQVGAAIVGWFMLLQVINLVMFVDIGCMPSKPERNKYGDPPGGGFGGGAPAGGAPYPGKSSPPRAVQSMPMGSTLTSAESAIERAIAARTKQAQTPGAAQPSPRPVVAATQTTEVLRPAAPGSFGRRATR